MYDEGGGCRNRLELIDIELTDETPAIDLIALYDALKKLQCRDPRKTELVKLRFFAGPTNQDDLAAVDQVLADWASGNLAATLFDLGAIIDDNEKDELWGEQGNDYLIGGASDKLKQ